jgi:WhiB family redox-sensing transcriptional regulator
VSWRDDARCAQIGTDLFYPEKAEATIAQTARRICGMCPVRDACLDEAMTTHEPHGVWGGLTAHERAQLRKKTAA